MDPQDLPPPGDRVPSSPTGRVPQWVLDEAAGIPVPPGPWAGPPAQARRGRRRGALLGVLTVPVLVLGGLALTGPVEWPWASRPPSPAPVVTPSPPAPTPAPPTDRPTPGGATAPLGRPPLPPPDGGTYAFSSLQDDGVAPVAYDPCRPVRYVLRPDGAPAGTEEIVHDAVAEIAEATGLRFVFDGYTDEPLAPDRAVYQPDRYGDRWAPVIIGWQTEAENPALAGDVVGEAGSASVSLGDRPRVFVTGTVSLDAGQVPAILAERDGAETVRAIVLHELGHLAGLAHVEDEAQLMFPETRSSVTELAGGDRTGLAALGAGACVPDL